MHAFRICYCNQEVRKSSLSYCTGVSGQVLDGSFTVVKNVSITLDSNHEIITAAEDGQFYIPLTQGPHTIHFKAEGTNSVVRFNNKGVKSIHTTCIHKRMEYLLLLLLC